MIDPNKSTPQEVLKRLKAASCERFRIELVKSLELLMDDFQLTWDDLAEKLAWPAEKTYSPGQIRGKEFRTTSYSGDEVKRIIGSGMLLTTELNDIAHVFSAEPYMIFRPRFPWVAT